MLSDTMMLGGGRKAAYSIENSLLFRGGQYLSRTPSVTGNRRVFTVRALVRPDVPNGSAPHVVLAAGPDINNRTCIYFDLNGYLSLLDVSGGTTRLSKLSTRIFRDPSSYGEVVVSFNVGEVKAYWNGEEITSWQMNVNTIASTSDTQINNTVLHRIGVLSDAPIGYFNSPMAEPLVVDGAALTPSSFGEFDFVTNTWRPKAITGVTWGINGFYLGKPWSVAGSVNDLGTDYSGKGNHWTPTGFVASDVLKDSPTNVYATMNPLCVSSHLALSNANLRVQADSDRANNYSVATIPILQGMKVYFEAQVSGMVAGVSGGSPALGVTQFADGSMSAASLTSSAALWNHPSTVLAGSSIIENDVLVGGVVNQSVGVVQNNDVMGVAVDYTGSAPVVQYFHQGQPFGTAVTGVPSSQPLFPVLDVWASVSVTANFGQRPFAFTPPSGFKALCTASLPIPVSAASKRPGKYYSCQTVVHNGSGTAVTLGWDALAADWLVRIKSLGGGDWHYIDTKRGLDKVLIGNSAQAEITNTAMVTNRTASGFVLGSGLAAATYLVEAWRVAPEAGFDIVLLDTSGALTQTVVHNNGVAPKFFVGKIRDLSDHWYAYHAGVGAGSYLKLNSTDGAVAYLNMWNNTAPTATQITLGSSWSNVSTKAVFYIWSEVPGFSKFGSYSGNGSADGSFIHLGFTAGDCTTKRTDAAGNWYCDTADQNNPAYPMVLEASNGRPAGGAVDICASGVKLRNADSSQNIGTMIYAAWAAHPLGAKRVTPSTAR